MIPPPKDSLKRPLLGLLIGNTSIIWSIVESQAAREGPLLSSSVMAAPVLRTLRRAPSKTLQQWKPAHPPIGFEVESYLLWPIGS